MSQPTCDYDDNPALLKISRADGDDVAYPPWLVCLDCLQNDPPDAHRVRGPFGPLEVIDKRSGGWMAIVNSATGKHYQDAYPDGSAPTTFARALASTGALSGYADQVAELATG